MEAHTATRRLLTGPEVQEILGCSRTTLYRLSLSGDLVPKHVGRLVRYRPADVERYLDRGHDEEAIPG